MNLIEQATQNIQPEDADDAERSTAALLKKLKDKPLPVKVLQLRTHNAALLIVQGLKGISFGDLSLNLYFYCKDKEYSDFTHTYESQMELAGANPERFIKNLHSFYNQMSARILKQNKMHDFCELIGSCYESLFGPAENNETQKKVIEQYVALLLGQLEYLRPSKFDLTKMVAGAASDGTPLTVADPFPMIDVPSYEITSLMQASKLREADFLRIYSKYGWNYKSFDDVSMDSVRNQIFLLNLGFLFPYINERTIDMLPEVPMSPFQEDVIRFIPYAKEELNTERLQERLLKRKRMLPGAGVVIRFGGELQEVKLKELTYNGAVCVMFRLRSQFGDTSGVYNPNTKQFLSFFGIDITVMAKQGLKTHRMLRDFILWAYAAMVCSDAAYQMPGIGDVFSLPGKALPQATVVEIVPQSGAGDKSPHQSGAKRAGDEKYEAVLASVNGYIRRLPDGQTASKDAVALAVALGYDLEPDETFVQPFSRRTFRLRHRETKE